MASIHILSLTFTIIHISAGIARAFVNLQCETEYVVQHGRDSLLECVIITTREVTDAQIRVVTWKKEGVEEPILVFHKGGIKKLPGYSFAEPSWNHRNMNVSLLITNTAVQDDGAYECMVMTNSGEALTKTSLKVTAKYNIPTITSKPEKIDQNTDGVLVCVSDGGYPRGQLRWFDEHNTDWTNSAEMKMKQTESGLFELSSTLTLKRASTFSSYTCQVFNASGGKEEAVTFNIPNSPEFYGVEPGKGLDPASKIVAPVVVIGSLIAGLLLALLIYRRRSRSEHKTVCTRDSYPEEVDQETVKKYQDSLA